MTSSSLANTTAFWNATDDNTTYPGILATAPTRSEIDRGEAAKVIVATLTLVLMWLFALFGNMLVCIVIYRSRRLQSTTNYFVVSLACGDIILAILCMPFMLGEILAQTWMFGLWMCKFVRFLQLLVTGTTLYVFVSICIDRYYTILYPLSFKITRMRAKQMIIGSWIASVVIASPSFYFYTIELDDVTGRPVCQRYITNTWDGVFYVIFHAITEYMLPIAMLVVGYSKIFRYIWTRAGLGGRTLQRTANPVPRPKVKMVKMIMVVNGVVISLMVPFFVLQLWNCSTTTQQEHVSDASLYIAVVWTYFATSVIKPAIYMCYNSNFRRGCKEVFCMSTMKCYRSSAYAITTASNFSKKNHVGVSADVSLSRDYRRMDSPSQTFDRSLMMDKYSWPLANNMPSTYL